MNHGIRGKQLFVYKGIIMNYLINMPKVKYRYLFIIYILSSIVGIHTKYEVSVGVLYWAMVFIEYRRILDAGKSRTCILTALAPILNWFYMFYLCFPDSKREVVTK